MPDVEQDDKVSYSRGKDEREEVWTQSYIRLGDTA